MNDFVNVFPVVGIAFFHAILPSHWMPLSIMAKRYNWRYLTLLKYVAGSMGVHIVSTFFFAWLLLRVGGILGVGEYLEKSSRWGTILLGLYYFFGTERKCNHDHNVFEQNNTEKYLLLFSMSVFSPCVELVPYLVYWGISPVCGFICAILYVLITVFVVTSMSLLFIKGYEFVRLDFVEKNEKQVMGGVLICVGFLMLFFK